MSATRSSRWGLLALGVLGLGAQSALRLDVSERQRDAGLVIPPRDDATQGLAADVAVPALALGAFRGLVIDYLWIRSLSLREQGRTYESRQIAEQITRLQPRLTEVWEYLAHDLAYNLASAAEDFEARWRWIQNGIALLRDDGLRLNPQQPELHYMLARIFQDRIGGVIDDYHMQFKFRHAQDLFHVLGDTTPSELADTPDLEDLLRDDPAVRALVAQGLALQQDFDLSRPSWMLLFQHEDVRNPDLQALLEQRPEVVDFLDTHRDTPPWDALLRSARKRRLWDAYRLRPEVMREVDEAWGPLDWRGVDAQAIYWAHLGIQAAEAQRDPRQRSQLTQTVILALKNVIRRGRIEVLPDRTLYLAPTVGLIERLDRVYLRETDAARTRARLLGDTPEHAEEVQRLEATAHNLNLARLDFMVEAVQLLFEYGEDARARALFTQAGQDYPFEPTFQIDYDEFILRVMAERFIDAGTFDSQVGVSQLVEGTWTRAYRALALGQDDRFRAMQRLATQQQRRWTRYLAAQAADDPTAARRLAVPFDGIRRRALFRAARGFTPPIRARLAQRLGIDPARLDDPPPNLPLPEPATPSVPGE